MDKVNLAEGFASFTDHWAPRIVGHYNGNDIRIVKLDGEFVWHSHEHTDDFFQVVEGRLDIELRDQIVTLEAGEIFVVPRGVEHRPVARYGEVKVINIEPSGTRNGEEGSPQREPVHL